MYEANEIQEVMGRSYGIGDDIDEAELEAEFDALGESSYCITVHSMYYIPRVGFWYLLIQVTTSWPTMILPFWMKSQHQMPLLLIQAKKVVKLMSLAFHAFQKQQNNPIPCNNM